MCAEMEPPMKKPKMLDLAVTETIDAYIKTMTESCQNLKAVLSDDFSKPVPLIKVFVGHVKHPRDISRVILTLNEKIPLKELRHLKRARKREVILCPMHFLNGMSSIQVYLECNVPELNDVFEYFKEVEVPMFAPKLKSQYNSLVWSCDFHPNKYYESLVSDNFFSYPEVTTHVTFMQIAFEIARFYLHTNIHTPTDFMMNINATVIVDPSINSVVAVSFFNNEHPVQHSAMLAIDNVAKTQNGGAWGVTNVNLEGDCTKSGVEDDLLMYLQQRFTKTNFRAKVYKSKRDSAKDNDGDSQSTPDGPYLCTGYYAYMLREPCLMCAMGLVHARMKRVFFCFNNLHYGALKSRTKLQAVSSLNHHFEVFTGFL